MADDAHLHKLCQAGDLNGISRFVGRLDRAALDERLANRKGVFGYTPLHEGVASGHSEVLDYLLERSGDGHVNCRANSGYTPMHLAASSGHVDCVKVLLKHNADISVKDEYGKTPKQTAELSSKTAIVRVLKGAEILKEVQNNGNGLEEMLQSGVEQLEENCLNEALMAAVHNDHDENVGILVVYGATNISQALILALNRKKVHASAMLLLIYAATDGNCNLVRQLFGEIGLEDLPCPDCSRSSGATQELISSMLNVSAKDQCCYDCLREVRDALKNRNIPTTTPIEIARRSIAKNTSIQRSKRCAHVRKALLMNTDVNKEEKYVYWHGLGLRLFDIDWLKEINWVKILTIGRNQLKALPAQMGVHLKQVTRLDIQYNELERIPEDLLLLPSLVDLNLSHNMLKSLPNVSEWSPSLTTLNLAFNNLSTFPDSIEAQSLLVLNISHNHFKTVPKSICSFSSLQRLDISNNQDILTLPVEMGRLSQLSYLNLTNLRDLHDPPRAVQGDAQNCIHYLNQKLQNVKPFYKMKLMLVGYAERGKSTLVAALQGKDPLEMPQQRTFGIDVCDWVYRPTLIGGTKFHFSIWDFGGQEEYYSTHQCFLSKRSMYLLVFNITHGANGVEELKPWLNNIALRAPGSCVLIVGTHLDLIDSRHKTAVVGDVLRRVKSLTQGYPNLVIPEVTTVGLLPPVENVSYLKEAIYKNAAQYKYKGQLVMGKQIPESYHKLDSQLQILRDDVRREKRQPIMHHEEFQTMVQQMKLGIHTDGELKAATAFLCNVGALLHYDDKRHSLHELYFIDPHWLCKMMAKIVCPNLGEYKDLIKDGIIKNADINSLFSQSGHGTQVDQFCSRYNFKFIAQYLTLLYRFEIALPLDRTRILVTSKLNSKRAKNIDIELFQDPPFHARYITFGSAETPPGFWSRYLARIMFSVAPVSDALQLNSTLPDNIIQSMSLGDVEEECKYTTESKVKYWQTGLYFNDRDVAFRVESLSESKMKATTNEHGIYIVASPNCSDYPSDKGIQIIGQLVDMAKSLLRELYPGLSETKQKIPCYECVRMKRQNPYEFSDEECWLAMEDHKNTIECRYDGKDPRKNHTMLVSRIVPDFFLQDIDHKFLLNQSQITNEETLLTKPTDYEKICQGVYRGSFVTIMYPYKSKEALSKLRSEVGILQKWHHPCLTCLMGIVLHPRLAVVMEKAPQSSLEWPLVTQKSPIHRITLFRIAAQVAAALKFLHKEAILFRDLKASNVLLWTLDSQSLCHCKLANYALSTQLHPTKVNTTKGFIAPEVLHTGSEARYNEMADIFSYGMLLYQIISRRNPYQDSTGARVPYPVQRGERPKLPSDSSTNIAFHYLRLAMECCWKEDPQMRPSAKNLLQYMCLSATQSIMSVIRTRDVSSMRYAQVVRTQRCNNVWVCSNGVDGLEIDIYNLNTMKRLKTTQFLGNFSSICLCKDHVWIATKQGVSNHLEIYNAASSKKEHEVKEWHSVVSCISCSDQNVYVGTLDGICFSFPIELKRVKQNPRTCKRELPETQSVNDILPLTCAGNKCLWVSHTRYLYFLHPETLDIEYVVYRGDTDDLVGKLCTMPNDPSVVWSAHIGGTMLSAWDVENRSMRFEVNVAQLLDEVYPRGRGAQNSITAIATALDTVWVGMTSGHILVFSNQELLLWHHPYSSYVQFITAIPGPGPCKTEQCLMLTGGQRFRCPVQDSFKHSNIAPETNASTGDGAAILLWEAFSKKMTVQMKFIEEKSSQLFDGFRQLRENLKKTELDFKDGTHILPEETFMVRLLSEERPVFRVTCPKPLKIATLLDKIKKRITELSANFKIEYRDSGSGECIEISSQEDLEKYAKIQDRPEIMCHPTLSETQ